MFRRKKRTTLQETNKPKLVPQGSGASPSKSPILSLESRLMFDAAATATASEVQSAQVAQEQAEAAVSGDNTSVPESQASVESQELLQAIAGYSPGETLIEVAFVDPTVPDYQSLLAGLGPNVQIVMLDGGQDGMEQIAASLAGRTGIDAIHIISHGTEGQLSLGTGTLNQESMSGQYADELAMIQQSLSESADILVYGCDFAEGQAGQDAVTLLSQLTGADVAASTDDTGYAALGGDWDLEVQTGTIETQVAITYDTRANWLNLLSLTASGSETRVNTTTSGAQTHNSAGTRYAPDSVAMDASGNYVSVWESAGNIYGQRYNNVGTAQGGEFVIASNAATERLASAAMNASGVFVVTWERLQGASNADIYARLYNSSGTAIGNEFLVNETTAHDQRQARVAMDVRGNFVVAWESSNNSGVNADCDIYAQQYDYLGVKAGANVLVNTTTAGDQARVDIAMDPVGNFVVVWEGERTAGDGVYSIYGQRYNSSGVAQGEEFLVNSLASSNDRHAAVAMNDSGNFVVTWDRLSGSDLDTQAQRFSGSGVEQGSAIAVTSNATYAQGIANVAMDAGGNFVVTWSSNTQDGSGYGVYTRQYDNTGIALTTESRVATTTSNAQDFSGVVYQNGKVVVTWSGNGIGDTSGIFMQRYDAAGGNAAPTITSNGGGVAASVSVAENSTVVTTVTATDASVGQTFTYSISGGADAAKFTINSSTGALAFVSAPNYESPTDNGGNNTYDVIVTVTDGVGGADSQVIAVTVTNTSDAPVLVDTALTLTVVEDAGAPSGAVGSLVSAFTGGVTDVDSGAAKGIAITGSNQTNGIWYYTTNGGTTWTAVGAVSNTSALLLADNGNTRLYFSPNANYNGTSTGALTLRAWDQTSGSAGTKVSTASNGGTTAFSSATDTIDVMVTAVNDAPVNSVPGAQTVAEDTPLVISGVSVTDVDGNLASTQLSVTNGTLSVSQAGGATISAGADGSGTLTLSGTEAQINAALATLTYQGMLNYNGSDTLTMVSTDSAGTPLSDTNTVAITVTAVNDTPTGLPLITGTVAEDQILTVDTSGMTDADGLGAFSYQWLRDGVVIAGATSSTYTLGDADVGTQISVTVSYTDGQGTKESVTSAQTAPVVNVNDAPILVTNIGSTVAEGGTDTIDVSELSVADVDNTAAQLIYTIGTGPLHGRLELTTAPGVNATIFTQADIAANQLVYIHNGSETTSDSFTFIVNDGVEGSIGLTTVTLTITPVNDTPTITNNGGGATAAISVAENVSAVTIVTGADVDLPTQPLTYSLSGGGDQARFTINAATGVLTFVAPPDFEVATDANGDNIYVVQVQVGDSQGASTTQAIQVTVTDVFESVPPPPPPSPAVPPVLLAPIPPTTPMPTAPPTDGSEPATPVPPATGGQTPVAPAGPKAPSVEVHPISQVPLTLVPPSDRPVTKLPDEVKQPRPEAEQERPLFLVKDDQGRSLFTVLPVEPTATLNPDPAGAKQPVSDLLIAKLDEMTASLEQAANVSQERHELVARVAAVTGTTLSVGFVAWALRSGAILASCLATMPAWRHFDPLPVVRLSRAERTRRREEMARAGQQEATEFSGLKRVLDDKPPLKWTG